MYPINIGVGHIQEVGNMEDPGKDFSTVIDVKAVGCVWTVAYHRQANVLLFIEDVTPHDQALTAFEMKPKRRNESSRSSRLTETIKSSTDTETPNEISMHSTGAYDLDSEETEGKNFFGFKTPKRHKQAPKTISSKANTSETGNSKQPRNLKQRMKTPHRLAKRNTNNDDDKDMSDDSADSDNSDEQSNEEEETLQKTGNQRKANLTEDFFRAKSSKSVTSDNTLAKLHEEGIFNQESLRNILTSRPNAFNEDINDLFQEYRLMYKTWMLQLSLGFNLILYGYGSKIKLLTDFRKSFCSKMNCVVVNGFFPSLTVKNILSAIAEECLGIASNSGDTDAIISSIAHYLEAQDEHLFLFVNNMDGFMMRSAVIQNALANLTSTSRVHVVATVDHINAPLLWNHSLYTKFKWLWHDVTTYEPYLEEILYENSLMLQQTGSLALKSMINVYRSLTPNAKNIFLLIIKYHMDHNSDATYSGIPFQMLYQKCRESFLVNSDQTLRAQLTEFRDHKLIKSKKGLDGAENLYLSGDLATIKDFIETVEKELI